MRSLHASFRTGIELEAHLTALPSFVNIRTDPGNTDAYRLLTTLREKTAQGESGPAWNTLLLFVLVTAALKRAGLKAGIYQGALDELCQLFTREGPCPEIAVVAANLINAGFVIPEYQDDTFCIGFDSSTYALTQANTNYFKGPDSSQNPFFFDQFCGFEINGPVFDGPETMARAFADMIEALKPLGLLTPDTCGIHQHIDIDRLTYGQFVNLMRIHAFCDDALRQTAFPPHRRESRFCRPLDHYFHKIPGLTSLEQLSLRLASLQREYDEAHSRCVISQPDLLKMIAWDVQANIYHSGRGNVAFYAITEALLNGTLMGQIEEILLEMRGQRYFDPSPESPYKKLTLERRLPPATDNPALARGWFILHHTAVKRAQICLDSEIIYDPKTQEHQLIVVEQSGKMEVYGSSFPEIMRYLGLPEDVLSHEMLTAVQDPKEWGYDLAEDKSNMGLWPKAKISCASEHSNDTDLQTAREEIYNCTEKAMLFPAEQQSPCNVITIYFTTPHQQAVNS